MSDVVIEWNNTYLEAIRQIGGSPCPIARAGAMMHGAMYDAINSVKRTHQSYLINVPNPPGTSLEAAGAYAAYLVLLNVYPTLKDLFDQALDTSIQSISQKYSPQNIDNGKLVGTAAAYAMISQRTYDGSENNAPYTSGNEPGDWRPTGSGDAASPNWPKVRPFTLKNGPQFRPPLPGAYKTKKEMLQSPEYAAQLNEVKRLGSANSTERTQEQTDIAFFWANDLDGTYKPPGHLFRMTQIVSQQRNLDLVQNARLFALVALTLGDAAIVAWDSKYSTIIDLWRPETAIRLADTDGNPATDKDESWEPLSKRRDGTRFSPPFPAYISGHATFGAAHSGIMRRYFGTDNVTFTLDTEDPSVPNLKRSFNSFTAAALENARSRIYLGVHFQWDGDHGFLSGSALANYVFSNFLEPIDDRNKNK